MHVAVVIVAYGNSADVLLCLDALARSSHADFEVVVCENAGAAARQELLRRAPTRLGAGQPVRVVGCDLNLGFAGGVNVCVGETPQADAWWLLNPDTEPTPNSMARLVGRLSSGDCDAVGSALVWPDGRAQSYGGRWQSWCARAVGIGYDGVLRDLDARAEIERELSYLSGASMMIGRRFLETVGPMREDYFLYCEEVEWCLRARSRGLRLGSAPDSVVIHHHGATTGDNVDPRRRSRLSTYLLERNGLLLTRDLYPMRLPVAACASLAVTVLKYGRVGAWRQLGEGLSGWLAGLMNRRGPPAWLALSVDASAPRLGKRKRAAKLVSAKDPTGVSLGT
jgi:N-acetylglucosaminyl-diphospho-decaprenol L-rhamnosyltransferase